MFVSDNSVSSAKAYFFDRLSDLFSPSELKLMFNEFLMSRLKLSRTNLLLAENLLLSESDLLYFRSCVHRLKENEPFQYILGSTEFYGLEIKCDRRALIPRPETEELVDWVVKDWKGQSPTIIDVCTGTGCIALALKSRFAQSLVEGVDVSIEALQLANENAELLEMDVQFQDLDVLEATQIGLKQQKWDVIVSNPPYIPVSDKAQMHENVLNFEPGLALFVSNEDPLLFYRTIGQLALSSLTPEGSLYVEIHEDLGEEVVSLFESIGLKNVECRKDMQGKNRMVKGIVG